MAGENYSLAISIDDKNEKFFSELEQKIATLACESKGKTAKLKLPDLELIKTTDNGKYKNVIICQDLHEQYRKGKL